MAKQEQVTVLYTDDLTGQTLGANAVKTVHFSLDGVGYEIDLSSENAQKLRDEISTWIGHARKSAGRRPPRAGTAPRGRAATDREQSTAMREWARENGFQVSDRGRIPGAVVKAYRNAT
jgi:hypothetical protein